MGAAVAMQIWNEYDENFAVLFGLRPSKHVVAIIKEVNLYTTIHVLINN